MKKEPTTVDAFIDALPQLAGQIGQIIAHRELSDREDPSAAPPVDPAPARLNLLRQIGVHRLYPHQSEALDALARGEHVVLATPTASGKSLVYGLSTLERIGRAPDTRCLYVSPLKALAEDQRRYFEILFDRGGSSGTTARYDGDTSAWFRKKIRTNPPSVILTNPEMIHLAMLPHHEQWADFWSNLSLVVIDEMHVCRGISGSHMALVFRRLRRICRLYGANPQFVLCSATIANPGPLAEEITGLPVSTIGGRRFGSGRQHVVLINPDDGPAQTAVQLLRASVSQGLRTIVFCNSRKLAELISVWTAQRLGPLADTVSPYRAGLLAEERREIERDLVSGQLRAVVTTSALELGIDIGDLDVCILVGFPGSLVATWQRAGRVGRSGQPSALFLVAGEDALDQYLMRHPDRFFSADIESAVINVRNPKVLAGHLECAAAEHSLDCDDAFITELDAAAVAEGLLDAGRLLLSDDGRRWHAARLRPHRDISLRGTGNRFGIMDSVARKQIGELDGFRVFREAYPGAIYLHRGRTYQVQQLDLETGIATVTPTTVDYFTRPRSTKDTAILETVVSRQVNGIAIAWGRMQITDHVTGYEVVRIQDRKTMAIRPLDLPPQVYETEGLWVRIPDRIQSALTGSEIHFMGSIHAVEHALIGVFPLVVMADRNDLGGIAMPFHPEVGSAAVFVYDGLPGGAGLTREGVDRFEALLDAATRAITDCPCENGCPACVHSPKCGSGNRPIEKNGARRLLSLLQSELETPIAATASPHLAMAPQPPDPSNPKGRRRLPALRRLRRHRRHANAPSERYPSPKPTAALTIKDAPSLKPKGAPVSRPPITKTNSAENANYGVFDLETQRSAQEVGGWHRAHRMRVSVGVLYDGRHDRFETYYESDMPTLIDRLHDFSGVVGFNSKRFDYAVLRPYTDLDLSALPTIDLLDHVHRYLGFRLSLNHLAKETLGAEKSADGLQALRWWRQGRIREIAEYCQADVAITRDLFQFGRSHGHVLFRNKAGDRVRVPVTW